jgi:peptide/nickel transport system ATP-binding protein/oligopeptide transport system ATP-binding protein
MHATDQPAIEKRPDCLLKVDDLKVHFPIHEGIFRRVVGQVKAVDGVSFEVPRASTVGLVGESGSGKSTIGKAIIQLVSIDSGAITYDGARISDCSGNEFFPYRKRIQMIFQDPFTSLNPRLTVFGIVSEALDIHFPAWEKDRKRERVAELLRRVGLEESCVDRYPHEFSGGQRQRIGIARALAVEPEFLICDEPVSSLDVSVQAQIINLLQDLQEELELTYLFIAHDLAVIEHVSDFVLVMTGGKIVEQAPADEVYRDPKHAYTRKLLSAIPKMGVLSDG